MKPVNLTFTKDDINIFKRLDTKELGEVFRQIINYIIMFENNLNPDASYIEIQFNNSFQRKIFNHFSLEIKKQLTKRDSEYDRVSLDELLNLFEKTSQENLEYIKSLNKEDDLEN